MSNIFLISDLHLGHTNILKFSPCRKGKTIDEHDQWLIDQWNSVINKRDIVYVLGDVAFNKYKLTKMDEMYGTKHLIRGNHDKFETSFYLKYFKEVYGLLNKHGFWLSHAPLHPESLWNKVNIHGHTHTNSVIINNELDKRYFNVSVEVLNGVPISLEEIKRRLNVCD